jgi:hypothetical protein
VRCDTCGVLGLVTLLFCTMLPVPIKRCGLRCAFQLGGRERCTRFCIGTQGLAILLCCASRFAQVDATVHSHSMCRTSWLMHTLDLLCWARQWHSAMGVVTCHYSSLLLFGLVQLTTACHAYGSRFPPLVFSMQVACWALSHGAFTVTVHCRLVYIGQIARNKVMLCNMKPV